MARFERSHQGLDLLLNSAPVRAALEARGRKIAAAANASMPRGVNEPVGYVMSSRPGPHRWSVAVLTATKHAVRHDRKHNTLVRALNGGTG